MRGRGCQCSAYRIRPCLFPARCLAALFLLSLCRGSLSVSILRQTQHSRRAEWWGDSQKKNSVGLGAFHIVRGRGSGSRIVVFTDLIANDGKDPPG